MQEQQKAQGAAKRKTTTRATKAKPKKKTKKVCLSFVCVLTASRRMPPKLPLVQLPTYGTVIW
jgi:hypothetical protein